MFYIFAMENLPRPSEKPGFTLFICYSRKNQAEKSRLITHLTPLAKKFNLELWHDEMIDPGESWEKSIEEKLSAMNIFLFLVSADSLASEFINQVEFAKALEKSHTKSVDLIPVLIHPCDWRAHDVEHFQFLPKNAKPVEDLAFWKNPDAGYAVVSEDLRKYLESRYFTKTDTKSPENDIFNDDLIAESNNSIIVSPSNPVPMYRESWGNTPSANPNPLPLQSILSAVKELGQYRSQLQELDFNLSGFKPDLSRLVNQINIFLKEFEDSLKSSGNEGHRIFRLILEIKNRASETRNQLLKAGNTSSKGQDALMRIKNNEVIYFNYSIEKLENELKVVLTEEFGIHPN